MKSIEFMDMAQGDVILASILICDSKRREPDTNSCWSSYIKIILETNYKSTASLDINIFKRLLSATTDEFPLEKRRELYSHLGDDFYEERYISPIPGVHNTPVQFKSDFCFECGERLQGPSCSYDVIEHWAWWCPKCLKYRLIKKDKKTPNRIFKKFVWCPNCQSWRGWLSRRFSYSSNGINEYECVKCGSLCVDEKRINGRPSTQLSLF